MEINYLYEKRGHPICRDSGSEFAELLGFNKVTEVQELVGNYIIELEWWTYEFLNMVNHLLSISDKTKYKVWVRIVDYHPLYYFDSYKEIADLIVRHGLQDKIVTPYSQSIFNLKTTVIPYHYEQSLEIPFDGTFDSRIPECVLTGNNLPNFYPGRAKLYELGIYPTIPHLSNGGTYKGLEFIKQLAKYQKMILTTSYNDYELLKYVECAQAGCAPIGDLPSDLRSELSSIGHAVDLTVEELAVWYRGAMKDIRGKDKIRNMYDELFE